MRRAYGSLWGRVWAQPPPTNVRSRCRRTVRRCPTVTRRGSNGGEVRWNALASFPDFGTRCSRRLRWSPTSRSARRRPWGGPSRRPGVTRSRGSCPVTVGCRGRRPGHSPSRAVRCFAMGYEDPPPPNRPVYVSISGPCRVRHFSHRGAFRGTSSAGTRTGRSMPNSVAWCMIRGVIRLPARTAARSRPKGRSSLGTGYSLLPPTLTGTVQCPTKRGMKTGTFMLKLKETK